MASSIATVASVDGTFYARAEDGSIREVTQGDTIYEGEEVFGDDMPDIASTKSLTGHALGAAGVNEAIYSLIMQEAGFIAASANIEELDPAAEGYPIVRERIDNAEFDCVMSNSFGFGGTNASLIFKKI